MRSRSQELPSPQNAKAKPRFTLQSACIGRSPWLPAHTPERSSQNVLEQPSRVSSQNSLQSPRRSSQSSQRSLRSSSQKTPRRSSQSSQRSLRSSSQNSQKSPRRSSQSSQRSPRSSSQNSHKTPRRSSQSSQQSTRRFSLNSQQSTQCSSQSSQNSPQHPRTSLFLRRSPLRSPPLRYEACSPGRNKSLSSKGTFTFSGFNSDDFPTDEDLETFSDDSSSTMSGEINSNPRLVEGVRALDIEKAARRNDQDHDYFLMCVGDVIEVEAESACSDDEVVVTTPDSLEGDVQKDVRIADPVPPGLVADYMVWSDSSKKVEKYSFLRAFTDLSVEDSTDCDHPAITLTGENPTDLIGEKANTETTGSPAVRVVGVEHANEENHALVEMEHGANGDDGAPEDRDVVQVEHADRDPCEQEDRVVVGVEHADVDACSQADRAVRRMERVVVGVEHADGDACVEEDRVVVGVEHADEDACSQAGRGVGMEHSDEDISTEEDRTLTGLEHDADGDACVQEDLVVDGIEHADVDTCCSLARREMGQSDEEDRALVGLELDADEDACVPEDRVVVGVELADGDACVQDGRVVVGEHANGELCEVHEDCGVVGEYADGYPSLHESCVAGAKCADKETCAQPKHDAVESFCSEEDSHDESPHTDGGPLVQEGHDVVLAGSSAREGVLKEKQENNRDACRPQMLEKSSRLYQKTEVHSMESSPEKSCSLGLPVILDENCSRRPPSFSDLLIEPEECDDLFVPGHPTVGAFNESTDLFADDLPDFSQPSHVSSKQDGLDDLMYSKLPKLGDPFKDIINIESGSNGQLGDLISARIKHLSTMDSLSEMQDCNHYFMRDQALPAAEERLSEVSKEEEFVVDIEAETLRRFKYYGAASGSQDEEPPNLSPVVEPNHMSEDDECMSGNSKPLIDDVHEQPTGSCSSSSSPNRDIDALSLTQCAPLKRKAQFKRENDPATKRTRKSWEQWYQQFKTIVTTGREKLRAQNSQTTSVENKENFTPLFSEVQSCDSINGMDSFEIQNQPNSFSMEQSCAQKSELVNCDCHEDGSDCEAQFSSISITDQLVPGQANLDITGGCSLNTSSHLKKSLFKWSSVEPSLKAVNYNNHQIENERTCENSRAPSVPQRPVRVGLSKRANPKPLHVRRQ
ncbi:uncharacterized protein LOC113202649 isoform X2 [Frankliniella occidentalis]|nr:uncharacterized protein LOC113202649 isoform X2 [Frankliniella occidentalis]